jgi:hypothetical protein
MRIGLILFGHLRSYRDTYSSFENLRKTLNQQGEVDIFCHTWDIEESVSAAWWKDHATDKALPPTVNENEMLSRFNPTMFEIEASKQFVEPKLGIKSSVPLSGVLSMLYSQLKSFELLKRKERQSGKDYDVIVKCRYDLLYDIASEFASIPEQAIKTIVFTYLRPILMNWLVLSAMSLLLAAESKWSLIFLSTITYCRLLGFVRKKDTGR